MEKTSLVAFIDESGSITKTDVEHHKYFIIAILFTRNSERIKRYFRKGIASLMQNNKYKELMHKNHEIKGSEVTETKKSKIYDQIIRNCKEDIDSKNHALIQLIDFISNTFYRNIAKHDRTSIKNVKLLQNYLCGGRFFDFSTNHDTKLFLNE